MGVYSRGTILTLSHPVQVSKNCLHVLLVLIEKGSFYCLGQPIHSLQTHLLLLLIQPVLVKIVDQLSPISNIQRSFLAYFFPLFIETNLIWNAHPFKMFYEFTEINGSTDTTKVLSFCIEVYPCQCNRSPVCLQDESVGIIPDPDDILSVVNHEFFCAICKESLYFGGLINFNVADEHFIFEIPYFKFFGGMGHKQMGVKGHFQDDVLHYRGTGANGEQLFGGLYPVESNCSLVAVTNAGVAVIVGQVPDDEFLPNINHFTGRLCGEVYQFYDEFAGTHSKHFAFLVELQGCYCTSVVLHFEMQCAFGEGLNVIDTEVAVIGKGKIAECQIDCTVSLPSIGWGRLFFTSNFSEFIGNNVLTGVVDLEDILVLETSYEILFQDVGFIEQDTSQMVLAQICVALVVFELLESIDHIGNHLDFLLFRQFRTEIIGLKWLFQEGQHHQIRHQQIIVSFARLRLQKKIFVESTIVDDTLHAPEVAVVVLSCEISWVTCDTTHPCFLTLTLVARQIQPDCLIIKQI